MAQTLFDHGVFGYLTIYLTVCNSNQKHYKVCVDRVVPYYDEFMNIFEMLNMMVQPSDKSRSTAVIIPRIQNLCFDQHLTYFKFFEKCREKNIEYDAKEKTGTMFLLSDDIERRSIGFVNVGNQS